MTTESKPKVSDEETKPFAREKHPLAIRWMHWLNFPLLTIMIWSGLRIYWANDVYAAGVGDFEIVKFFPEPVYETLGLGARLARGTAYHFTFGWFFAINGIAYAFYLAISGQWRHLIPDRKALWEAKDVVLHDLKLKKQAPPQGRYNAAQQLSYSLIILLGGVAVISGLAIYKPTQLSWLTAIFGGYEGARLIHFIVTIAFLVFFVIHILQVIKAGWANFSSMITGYYPVKRSAK